MTLTQQIHSRQIDNLVAAAAENCFRHEQAETFCLLQSNRRWHREFLTRYKNLDQCRAVMFESLRNHRFYLFWRLRFQSENSCSFRDRCELRIAQVRSKIYEARRLHFQFNKGKRIVP